MMTQVYKNMKDLKICTICGEIKESNPTPEGDEVCPNCGDREMMDYEQDFQPIPRNRIANWRKYAREYGRK
jgi:hypothetical protein